MPPMPQKTACIISGKKSRLINDRDPTVSVSVLVAVTVPRAAVVGRAIVGAAARVALRVGTTVSVTTAEVGAIVGVAVACNVRFAMMIGCTTTGGQGKFPRM